MDRVIFTNSFSPDYLVAKMPAFDAVEALFVADTKDAFVLEMKALFADMEAGSLASFEKRLIKFDSLDSKNLSLLYVALREKAGTSEEFQKIILQKIDQSSGLINLYTAPTKFDLDTTEVAALRIKLVIVKYVTIAALATFTVGAAVIAYKYFAKDVQEKYDVIVPSELLIAPSLPEQNLVSENQESPVVVDDNLSTTNTSLSLVTDLIANQTEVVEEGAVDLSIKERVVTWLTSESAQPVLKASILFGSFYLREIIQTLGTMDVITRLVQADENAYRCELKRNKAELAQWKVLLASMTESKYPVTDNKTESALESEVQLGYNQEIDNALRSLNESEQEAREAIAERDQLLNRLPQLKWEFEGLDTEAVLDRSLFARAEATVQEEADKEADEAKLDRDMFTRAEATVNPPPSNRLALSPTPNPFEDPFRDMEEFERRRYTLGIGQAAAARAAAEADQLARAARAAANE